MRGVFCLLFLCLVGVSIGGEFVGVVVNEYSGKPVGGAEVFYTPLFEFEGGVVEGVERVAKCDEEGRFRIGEGISAVRIGRVSAEGFAPYFYPLGGEFEVWRGEKGGVFEIRMIRENTIKVKFVDERGEPVEGVQVQAGGSFGYGEGVSGEDGVALIHGVACPGSLSYGKAGFVEGCKRDLWINFGQVGYGEMLDVGKIVLRRGMFLKGKVVDTEGVPVGKALVRVGTAFDTEWTECDREGNFILWGLKAGEDNLVEVKLPGSALIYRFTFFVPEGKGVEVTARVKRFGAVHKIRVLYKGMPVEGAEVRAELEGVRGVGLEGEIEEARGRKKGVEVCIRGIKTDEEGVCVIRGVPEIIKGLMVYKRGVGCGGISSLSGEGEIVLSERKPLKGETAWRRFEGVVLEGGKPVKRFFIRPVYKYEVARRSAFIERVFKTPLVVSENGAFRIYVPEEPPNAQVRPDLPIKLDRVEIWTDKWYGVLGEDGRVADRKELAKVEIVAKDKKRRAYEFARVSLVGIDRKSGKPFRGHRFVYSGITLKGGLAEFFVPYGIYEASFIKLGDYKIAAKMRVEVKKSPLRCSLIEGEGLD